MIIYEFWLKDEFKEQVIDILCDIFYKIGFISDRWDNPVDESGNPRDGSCVYSLSRNPETHWVQLLVDDNTPQPFITAIEARINGLKDDEPFKKWNDDIHNSAPMETPKEFTLERVLRVRQQQKDGTLRRIEDA